MDERSRTWEQTDEFRVADYKPFQALDGEGLRCSLYVSYCPFNCLGCYNKAAQKKGYGNPYTAELEERILRDLANPHVAGLTLVGGEPSTSSSTGSSSRRSATKATSSPSPAPPTSASSTFPSRWWPARR